MMFAANRSLRDTMTYFPPYARTGVEFGHVVVDEVGFGGLHRLDEAADG